MPSESRCSDYHTTSSTPSEIPNLASVLLDPPQDTTPTTTIDCLNQSSTLGYTYQSQRKYRHLSTPPIGYCAMTTLYESQQGNTCKMPKRMSAHYWSTEEDDCFIQDILCFRLRLRSRGGRERSLLRVEESWDDLTKRYNKHADERNWRRRNLRALESRYIKLQRDSDPRLRRLEESFGLVPWSTQPSLGEPEPLQNVQSSVNESSMLSTHRSGASASWQLLSNTNPASMHGDQQSNANHVQNTVTGSAANPRHQNTGLMSYASNGNQQPDANLAPKISTGLMGTSAPPAYSMYPDDYNTSRGVAQASTYSYQDARPTADGSSPGEDLFEAASDSDESEQQPSNSTENSEKNPSSYQPYQW